MMCPTSDGHKRRRKSPDGLSFIYSRKSPGMITLGGSAGIDGPQWKCACVVVNVMNVVLEPVKTLPDFYRLPGVPAKTKKTPETR